MQRRNFIKLAAASGAGVLFGRLASFAAPGVSLINAPDEVAVLLDGGWVKCIASNARNFSYQSVTVSLDARHDEMAFMLNSPHMAVKEVKFKWHHHLNTPSLCLGDHWERTYGDVSWHKPEQGKKEPWYVLVHDENSTACFGVKTGCNSICWWAFGTDTLELTMDTRAAGVGVSLGARTLHLASVITMANKPDEIVFATARRFCKMMCPQSRLPAQPVYGINDWYYAYGNNTPQLILEQTRLMAELVTDTHNKPFSVIDAGWASYSPKLPGDCCWQDDFSKPNEKFKDMQQMAGQITETGMRPGLWTRPLCARYNDPAGLLLPKINGRNNPLNPVLDPTINDNIERIKQNITIYKEWGFEMVKHDFTTYDITGRWGFEMADGITEDGWRFQDSSRTTAEVIKHLYAGIREAAGDMYLIGCNTMSHLAAGVFELNRVGDDTSGKEWDRTRKMGVNTLAFRMCQHKTFYYADGDCVGLTNQVPWSKNKQWMQLLAESSTPLFISAQPNALGQEQRQFIKTCFAQAAKVQPVGEPLDWLNNMLPAKWKLDGEVKNFEW